eukprot:TRINITY_DN81257_c0_g1_i1.p1 TRINITY_DN81257_c0_g1~~TRINITY_DN81257_c0_g1_i1.p1  ORF type:complete len:634 (+),score=143.22 TRINITY_DN81257_c0_g1_i1:64-1902(+)
MEHTTFSLEVPLNKGSTKLLATGLKVLREFAFEALLRAEDIQLEKAVVEEEWRSRLGVQQRMEEQFWSTIFSSSRHASRLPIGKMEVVHACPDDRLRAFYKKWYRAENMAVICTGDFQNNNVAERLLQEAFANVASPCEAYVPCPTAELRASPRAVVVYRDKELSSYQVRLRIFFKDRPRRTLRDIAVDLSQDLLLLALNRRLSAMQQRSGAAFIAAAASEENLSNTCKCILVSATVLKGNICAAAKTLAETVASISHFGITEREMALVQKLHNTALESVWAERHHVETEDVMECAEEYVLSGSQTRMCSDHLDVRLQLKAMQMLTSDGPVQDIGLQRAALKLSLNSGEWSIEAEIAGQANDDLEVTDSELRACVEAFESSGRLEPFVWLPGELLDESSTNLSDMVEAGLPASIVDRTSLVHFPGEHWVLSNGSTVTWMRTDFEPDEIVIQGIAVGGTSELDGAAERAACSCIDAMRCLDGLGKSTKSQLSELLADKQASMQTCVQGYSHSLSGRCGSSSKDFEAALCLASLHFTPANFTRSSFAKVLDATRQRLANREREPDYHLYKKLKEVTCGSDSFFRELTMQDVDELEMIGTHGTCEMYARFYANPS